MQHLDRIDHALGLVLAPALIEYYPHNNRWERDVLLNHGGKLRLKICLGRCIDGAVFCPTVRIPGQTVLEYMNTQANGNRA